jgi:ATF/CREB family transcription factor
MFTAALKCRQRKKAWLASLQQKVEFLQTDNDQLSATVARLREEIASLRGILVAHKDCPVAMTNGHMHHASHHHPPHVPAGGHAYGSRY